MRNTPSQLNIDSFRAACNGGGIQKHCGRAATQKIAIFHDTVQEHFVNNYAYTVIGQYIYDGEDLGHPYIKSIMIPVL